jgi:hypothetical protein
MKQVLARSLPDIDSLLEFLKANGATGLLVVSLDRTEFLNGKLKVQQV